MTSHRRYATYGDGDDDDYDDDNDDLQLVSHNEDDTDEYDNEDGDDDHDGDNEDDDEHNDDDDHDISVTDLCPRVVPVSVGLLREEQVRARGEESYCSGGGHEGASHQPR